MIIKMILNIYKYYMSINRHMPYIIHCMPYAWSKPFMLWLGNKKEWLPQTHQCSWTQHSLRSDLGVAQGGNQINKLQVYTSH